MRVGGASLHLAAVVPAHNEARTITAVVEGLLQACSSIVVVDDGSEDSTGRLARDCGAQVYRFERSLGYSAAVTKGFEIALAQRPDLILTVDGDFAHTLSDIPAIAAHHITTGAAVTVGDRFRRVGANVNSTKVFANRVAAELVGQVYDELKGLKDVASGFRVFEPAYAGSLIGDGRSMPRFGLCYFSVLAALRYGREIAAYPTRVRYDAAQLLATKKCEFLDLIATVQMFASREYGQLLEGIRASILHGKCVRFDIGSESIFALPVRGTDAYIFQYQDACFSKYTTPEGCTTITLACHTDN